MTDYQLTRQFRDGDRIAVTDTADRFYGEVGAVENWFYGMSGRVHYQCYLDGRDELLSFAEGQLAYEGEVQ